VPKNLQRRNHAADPLSTVFAGITLAAYVSMQPGSTYPFSDRQ
jgi:hypothetical protein